MRWRGDHLLKSSSIEPILSVCASRDNGTPAERRSAGRDGACSDACTCGVCASSEERLGRMHAHRGRWREMARRWCRGRLSELDPRCMHMWRWREVAGRSPAPAAESSAGLDAVAFIQMSVRQNPLPTCRHKHQSEQRAEARRGSRRCSTCAVLYEQGQFVRVSVGRETGNESYLQDFP